MNPTYEFTGQVALVTAAEGLATVRAYAEAGATVYTLGRLDMAFDNAGSQVPSSDAADEPAEVFDRVNTINLRGLWACMKHEVGQMRAQGSGAIVNCSSLGALVGIPGRAAYHASKHGVVGLTTSAALEYAPRGIRINAICPGTIETAMVAEMVAQGELDRTEAAAATPIGRSAMARRSQHPSCGSATPAPASWPASRSPSTAATPPSDQRQQRGRFDRRSPHVQPTKETEPCMSAPQAAAA